MFKKKNCNKKKRFGPLIFYGDFGKGSTHLKAPCYMCDSARVSSDLERGFDFSAVSVGITDDRERFMILSGNDQAVRIVFERFNDVYGHWSGCGSYYPKYCPNCGRELLEYSVNDCETSFDYWEGELYE